jgi:hypothetical protein
MRVLLIFICGILNCIITPAQNRNGQHQHLNGPGPNYYLIEAKADPLNATIKGTVTLRYINPLDHPVSMIPLRVKNPVNYFHHDIVIHDVMDNTNELMELQQDSGSLDIYNVALTSLLEPGDGKEIIIRFTSNLIYQYDYHLTNGLWHPKAVVYREGEFSLTEEQSDNFEVHLTVPPGYSVLSSGTVKSEVAENDLSRLHLTADNITGFGLVLSDNLSITELNSRNVQIKAACPEEMKETYERLLFTASDVIDFYINTFGFYPQPMLVILPGASSSTGGFPLASNMVVIHRPLLDDEPFAKWIIAHEIGHQVWGFDYLIDGGKYGKWLGLGLGIWADRLYNQSMNREGLRMMHIFIERYMAGVRSGYNTSLMQDYRQLAELDFDWNNIISHGKGYSVIYLLEQVLGEEVFFNFACYLLDNYRHQYLSVKDFQNAAESISGEDLSWFFDDWIYSGKKLEYGIDSVITRDNGFEIHVNRGDGARLPVNIDIILENGDELTIPLDFQMSNQVLFSESDHKPMNVRIDNRFNEFLADQEAGRWTGNYSGLQIIDIEIPELAWNINRASIIITNTSSRSREVSIHIQTRTIDGFMGGYGRGIVYGLEPGDTMNVEREIAFRPVPGRQNGTITIKDAGIDHIIYQTTVESKFPYLNKRINPFFTEDFSIPEYGPGERARHEPGQRLPQL